MALRLGFPIQELQEKTTSTEFIEWQEILQEERNEPSADQYYLAQIACLVANFMQGFTKSPKKLDIDKFLLKFTAQEGEEVVVRRRKKKGNRKKEEPITSTQGRRPITPGDPLDEKWQAVNTKAKMVWAARLGLKPTDLGIQEE